MSWKSWLPSWERRFCALNWKSRHNRAKTTPATFSWMDVMRADKKAIFTASARANEAAAYLTP